MAETLGIVLASDRHGQAHAAFMLAAGAAALGRSVILFAMGAGVHCLCAAPLDDARDSVLAERGVATLEELRTAVLELGGKLIACESALAAEAIGPERLLNGITVAGMASFLEATRQAQLVSF